jgi:hypothetical protein
VKLFNFNWSSLGIHEGLTDGALEMKWHDCTWNWVDFIFLLTLLQTDGDYQIMGNHVKIRDSDAETVNASLRTCVVTYRRIVQTAAMRKTAKVGP